MKQTNIQMKSVEKAASVDPSAILNSIKIAIYIAASLSGDAYALQGGRYKEIIINDPPSSAGKPLLSKRFEDAEKIAAVRIISADEIREAKGVCGYSYKALVVEPFKGVQKEDFIKFMSFQPYSFHVGGYYLAFLGRDFYTDSKFDGDDEPWINIQGNSVTVDFDKCKRRFEKYYGDDVNFSPIKPALTEFFTNKWAVVNSLDNRMDEVLNNDQETTMSPCIKEELEFQYCIKWDEMKRFIMNAIGE